MVCGFHVLPMHNCADCVSEDLPDFAGAPDTIRTCDLCLRRATLYPAELRVHWRSFSRLFRYRQCPGRPEEASLQSPKPDPLFALQLLARRAHIPEGLEALPCGFARGDARRRNINGRIGQREGGNVA